MLGAHEPELGRGAGVRTGDDDADVATPALRFVRTGRARLRRLQPMTVCEVEVVAEPRCRDALRISEDYDNVSANAQVDDRRCSTKTGSWL